MADVMDLPPDPPLIRDDKRRERKERSLDDRSRRDRDPRERREDDDRGLRRDYVDRRSDDDRPGSALGRDRERDYKRRRSPSPSPPPLQRSRRDDDHDGGRRGSPRDRRIVSGPSQSNALVADERSHLKLRGVRSDSGKVGHMDASETGTRRDGLMTYKQFISELNDDISPAESELRYSEYQKKAFFEQNKQDWFRHKYDPSRSEAMIQGIWIRKACKIHDEYKIVKDIAVSRGFDGVNTAQASTEGAPPLALPAATDAAQSDSKGQESALAVVVPQPLGRSEPGLETMAVPPSSTLSEYRPPERSIPSAAIMKRLPSRWPRPAWHPPWKNYRVISGHLGWVRSIAFDPGNEWFCTGSADRTIKIWDLGSGQLKLTLTGHIEQVRGLAVSSKFPYMFSAGDDKQVKCWDLEYNKVIRSYHGHLSGVYCLSLHPTQDILLTGGRDSVCRVWDMRTKAQVHALSGHENTVCSVITQAKDPQVVTGSHDTTIKLWDLAAGKSISTLTFHKKSVRALAMHPFENSFASASADNIKKFRLPKGEFLHNMLAQQRTIVNCMAVNEENVLASGGDNGSIWWWDWKSGHNFQQVQTIVQPGSLDSEAGIYALSYDITGTRLVTCETDKTIKMWKEDEDATPETHPINFKPPKDMRRF